MTRPLVLLVLLAACGPAARLVKEGREATAAQQWGVAYRAYDNALRYKPDHPEALSGRSRARQILLDDAEARLTQALSGGRLHDLAPVLDEARRVQPDPAWVAGWQDRWQQAWVQRLEAAHADARSSGARGHTWVYASSLAALDAQPFREHDLDEAWQDLREAEWPAVEVSGTGRTSRSMAGDVAVRWRDAPWSAVPVVAGQADIGLRMDVRELGCSTVRVGTRTAIQRYRDGTMVANPRIPELRRLLDQAHGRLGEARGTLQARQVEEDVAARAAQEATARLQSALPELDAAQRQVVDAAHRRDALRAAVTEAEDAVDTIAHLRGEQHRLREERRQLLEDRRLLDVAHGRLQAQVEATRLRVDDAQQTLKLARDQVRTAKDEAERVQERLETLKAERQQALEALEELEVEPAPPQDRLPGIPRLTERLEQAQAALDEATSAHQALQRARDQAAQAATTGGAAELAALEAAEAALAAHQPQVVAAATAHREARVALEQGRLQVVERRLQRTRAAAAEARQAQQDATEAARALEPALTQARAELSASQAELADVDQSLAAVADRLQHIDQRLPRLHARVERLTPTATDLARRQQDFRRALSDWRETEAILDEVGRMTADLTLARDHSEQAYRDARQRQLEASATVEGWVDRLELLRAELDGQPDRVELDKQAEYTITTHRRTCTARVDWSTHAPHAGTHADQLVLTKIDEDDSTPARPRIRLAADPLSFDVADEQVVLALRARASATLFDTLSAHVTAEGQARREAAPASGDARTRALAVASYMSPDADALTRHLQQAYDLPRRSP